MLNAHRASVAGSWTPQPQPSCRLCGARLHRTLIDLGDLPLANRTLAANDNDAQCYRLHARICDSCTLVQIADVASPEMLATPKSHLPSRSASRLSQARCYAEAMTKRFRLGSDSLVIEVGCNDGCLLSQFQAIAIPVLGIDCPPASPSSAVVPAKSACFNTGMAMEIAVRHGRANLVIANNIMSHVPDPFDFAAGLASILRPNGIISLQVPHLLSLVQNLHFDGFRHDAYTYLSLRVLEQVLRSVGLRVFDAERLSDHGGSLRIYACHAAGPHSARPGLKAVRQAEQCVEREGDFYSGFSNRVALARDEIVGFLRNRAAGGRRVAAYGATTRGGMLINYCKMTNKELTCVVDPDPAKHNRLLVGSRIPIVPLQAVLADPPDDLIILPWPDVREIVAELSPLRQYGTQFWIAVPRIARV